MPRLSKIGAAALAAFGWTAGGATAVTASYLVVAGGGGGNGFNGGGGGAGGLLSGTTPLNTTLSYTIVVGAGGLYVNGNNSTALSVTAIGGGCGGSGGNAADQVPLTGGSGGGGGSNNNAAYATGAAGTAGQGNAGGNAPSAGGNYPSAGGGGAGGVGQTIGSNGATTAGAGGVGVASSITGSSVTYAGGGGGAIVSGTPGAGGAGGGGAGGVYGASNGAAGGANTGGGSGGGGGNGFTTGPGGSGVVIISYPAPQKFGGGVVTASGANIIHTFTTSGTLSPLSSLTASTLVVAGGGGGGANGGGGGAGGYRTGSGITLDTNSTYLVAVGAGGGGGSYPSPPSSNGSDSVFSSITSSGGGSGYTALDAGGAPNSGGSGGGGGFSTPGAAGNTPSTSPSQGNNGGNGFASPPYGFGGGGGSGAVGANGTASNGGNGGAGTASSISGSSVTRAGGGGGGIYFGNTPGTGAAGGGNGGSNGASGTSATANTGSGGGGGGSNGSNLPPGGNGGSGIVIISYAGSTQLMAGGTVTVAGGNVIHTFTSSGFLSPIVLVNNSLRFRSSASAFLNRTPTSAGNQKVWTYSVWVKRGSLTTPQWILGAGAVATDYTIIRFGSNSNNNDNLEYARVVGSAINAQKISTAVYRDPSAWYHIVVTEDAINAVSRMYVNGTEVTYSTNTNPTNVTGAVNASVIHNIGRYTGLNIQMFDGYMAEINLIDGQALTPSSFGGTNGLGVWQPVRYGGSYGTNGFYLPFTDNSALTTSSNVGLGKDFSSNGNFFATNNISITAGSTYDSMTDVPTLTSATAANYCVFNPLVTPPVGTISQANTLYERDTFGGVGRSLGARGTIGVSSGKFYFELGFVAEGSNGGTSGTADDIFGVISITAPADIGTDYQVYNLAWIYQGNGNKANGSSSAYGASLAQGDIIGVALDMDSGKIWFSKNGTFQASGDPVAGTNAAFTNLAGNTLLPVVACYNNLIGTVRQRNINCGQRPFAYTPPTGFVALNTFNLPTPTIGATASTQANKYFDATLYTGNGTDNRAVTGLGFQPDFTWIKQRSAGGQSHILTDAVRGTNKVIFSNSAAPEATETQYLKTFTSDGFTLGADAAVNENGGSFVAWSWDANGTGVSNTAGSITSTVSANTSAGFSVVTYTGNGTGGATVGHGLGIAPSMMIVKRRDVSDDNWPVYTKALGSTKVLLLNTTAAESTSSTNWNNTNPTSSVFSIGTSGRVNASSNNYVAYCFSEVVGYSKFGSYVGNGSADGSFIFTGFSPKFVMTKRTDSTSNWTMQDDARSPSNATNAALFANLSLAEQTGYAVDLLSNGFKIRDNGGDLNASGGTYIYMAFAENPFKYANAR